VVGGSVSLVQPLYTFGKIDSVLDAAAHGVKARGAMVLATEADVALEVAKLYESLLLAREATRFAEELENSLSRTLVATDQRVAAHAPEVGEKDVLRLQAALSAVRIVLLASASGAYTPGRDVVTSRYVVDPLNSFVPVVLLGARWQFQGNMATGRADERMAQADEQRRLASWAQAGVPAQVKVANADVERARSDMAEAETAVARAKKWMVEANADYVAGLADSASVVDATRAYAELRAAGLDATFRHNVAMAELAHATGSIVTDSLGLYPGKRRAP
jgi:outer membrane protein TolC